MKYSNLKKQISYTSKYGEQPDEHKASTDLLTIERQFILDAIKALYTSSATKPPLVIGGADPVLVQLACAAAKALDIQLEFKDEKAEQFATDMSVQDLNKSITSFKDEDLFNEVQDAVNDVSVSSTTVAPLA